MRQGAHRALIGVAFAVLTAGSIPPDADAQGIISRLKDKAKERLDSLKAKADSATNAATDSAMNKGIDKATGAVKCLVSNAACIKNAAEQGKAVMVVNQQGKPVSAADSAAAMAAAGGPASLSGVVNANYDFVPGDQVLFAEDFTRDAVGNPATRLKLIGGNTDVVDWNGQRFLRATEDAKLAIPLASVLPDRFTLELDYVGDPTWDFEIWLVDDAQQGDKGHLKFTVHGGGVDAGSAGGASAESNLPPKEVTRVAHLRVMGDGGSLKAYVNGTRVANVPQVALGRSNAIYLKMPAQNGAPSYVTNIRVAVGGRKLYDALMASGRAVTHGLLFDTGSDQLRAESKPTLDEIGQMLMQHPDLRLSIEGHTDNVGDASANQSLSERRAASVRSYLVANYRIDGMRLIASGYGATHPAMTNDTPEGRQMNRRVELVKR